MPGRFPALIGLTLMSCYPAASLEKEAGFDTAGVVADSGDDTAAGDGGGSGDSGSDGGPGGGSEGGGSGGSGGSDGDSSGGSDGGGDGGPVGEAPTCVIDRPSAGGSDPFTRDIRLRGVASDTEDGDLSAVMSWSSDLQGSLGVGADLSVEPTVSGVHTITCSVEDSDGNVGSDAVQFTVVSPLIEITSPDDGDTRDEGDRVRLRCDAEDLEDGQLSGSAVAWTSSRDGTIDDGCSIDTRDLSRGDHVLTATATDSDGNTASDSVEITIERD